MYYLSNVLQTVVFATFVLFITAAVQYGQTGTTRPSHQLWQDRGDISKLDLRYGPGSRGRAPVPPFTYIEEDKEGSSPKIRVKDARSVTWVVKLGPESQAETVATRIVWAAGYFVEEAYYLQRVAIDRLPRLSRGREYVENGRVLRGARFEPRREGVKRGGVWRWLKNPFVGTRELNGLKVLMVLLNNYDPRTDNNRILRVNGTDRYVVTDIGATLGYVGGLGGHRSKNSLGDFRRSRFIRKVENGMVEFDYDTTPKGLGYFTFVLAPHYWRSQANKERAMKRVSVRDARWIGNIMARLTVNQLTRAFDAAGYDRSTSAGFISVIRERSRQLRDLPNFVPRQQIQLRARAG